jgi:peptide/nickel transport system permease protein
MTEASLSMESATERQAGPKAASSTLVRVAKFTAVRIIVLFLTVVVGVYLAIMAANMGGYVDEIRKGMIREAISVDVFNDQSAEMRRLSPEEKKALIEERVALEEHRLRLDRPFLVRSFAFLTDALSLNLGRAQQMISDSGSKQVRNIILERLPSTLVLFGTGNLLVFFLSLFVGLSLSRSYGSVVDRLVAALAPTSSAPAWFYGIFLILIFAAVLRILPFGSMVDAPPPENPLLYALSLAKHLVLPVTAMLISAVFVNIYGNRTFFLIYSSEDYVEMAKAKGLSDREIERRYILRPTLPTIITGFALLLITVWQGAIILETVFNWPGLGKLFFQAIGQYDIPVIVGNTVIYAYLLGMTVFLLEFIYALVDPRVRIGGAAGAN